MDPLIITIALTFCLVAAWQLYIIRKVRTTQRLMTEALIVELHDLSKKLGYTDYITYLELTRGPEYAKATENNLRSFADSFAERAPKKQIIEK